MFNMGQNTARSKRLNVSTLSLAVYTGWFVALCSESCTAQTVYDIEESGAVADVDTIEQMQSNAEIIQTILDEMEDGDTLYVPNKTFHTVGGLSRSELTDATFRFDGTLKFSSDRETWPKTDEGKVMDCLSFDNLENVRFTSSGKGTLDGNGKDWWGSLNYMTYQEDRPKILFVGDSQGLIVENLLLKDSPFWTLDFQDVIDVTIRYCDVDVRFNADATAHDEVELQAYNTDGFDIAGENVHIHDCNIWNSDDCIAVKDLGDGGGNRARCSQNWLVERVNASGGGLTIGSIGTTSENTCVRNITFRDCSMTDTYKGIYMKSRGPYVNGLTATIEDVLYENIVIESPIQWALWIGPAQQLSGGNGDNLDVCSLLWPDVGGTQCAVQAGVWWNNITLRNIVINNPTMSPGVIIGNETNPMRNVVFDNVTVTNAGREPWGENFYACYGVNGTSRGGTSPIPPCFNGGQQCSHSVRASIMGEDCKDQDHAISLVTMGYLTSCSQAITLEPEACVDSSNAFFDIAQELCQASCSLCGETTSSPSNCEDDDAMIEQLTGGMLTSCAAAVQVMPEACTDPSNAYYNAAHAYCKVSCDLCTNTRYRRTTNTLARQCGYQLSYVCDVDDMCTPSASPQTLSEGATVVVVIASIGVFALVVYGVVEYRRRSRFGYLSM
eukprot:m.240610 g.240610  ORF g.240610 m.240610 type:complete len:668 (-) comp33765_c0_seq1:80-2083(-)